MVEQNKNLIIADARSVPSKALIDAKTIKEKIYNIRNQKVMLDVDLAEIYGYSTRAFNQQVKNNIEKFEGEDFMFQLTSDGFKNLMSKNSTSSWGGRRKIPYAFTEQGVYMLMTVLRGELATMQSKALVRTFKQMKDYIVENKDLIGANELAQLIRANDLCAFCCRFCGFELHFREVFPENVYEIDQKGNKRGGKETNAGNR